ncbi:hypothetical protein BFF78_26450 [Streptomyces fodineus]|uniref:Uncharacterized protein n=1 Tax=Streptomyces fodineus TaxID=1904616 RepID=A0A1D7YFK9_9ACTN|nr:hypothetical protein [Streptomyces fodineus]AOR34119.1 hypothetical protein BFF78_26450 [Streptomyces fodineus]
MSSIRHALVTAVLAGAALTLTACQPDGTGAAGDTGSSPTATASPAAHGGGKQSSCPVPAKGHKIILVESVSGAMNTITAKDARMICSTTGEGASYRPAGHESTYLAQPDAPIKVISRKTGKQRQMGAAHGGIAHVRVCADGTAQDTATAPADTSDCYGQNYYDVAVDNTGKLTEMTELYGS